MQPTNEMLSFPFFGGHGTASLFKVEFAAFLGGKSEASCGPCRFPGDVTLQVLCSRIAITMCLRSQLEPLVHKQNIYTVLSTTKYV